MPLAVKAGAVAIPLALVITVALPPNVPDAPDTGAAKVTLAPAIGLLDASFTVACNAVANEVEIGALCGVPAVALMLAGAPGVLVIEKLAGATPLTVAVTEYEPATVLAVNVGAVATPLALVVTVALAPNVPEAPDNGAANVTLTPAIGLLDASLTVACSPVANAVVIAALCGVPAVAVMLAGAPAVLVIEKLAGATPLAVAVTQYEPATVLAVNAGAVATPLAMAVAVALAPNVPEAPEPGAVNVTLTPGIGLENASRTMA